MDNLALKLGVNQQYSRLETYLSYHNYGSKIELSREAIKTLGNTPPAEFINKHLGETIKLYKYGLENQDKQINVIEKYEAYKEIRKAESNGDLGILALRKFPEYQDGRDIQALEKLISYKESIEEYFTTRDIDITKVQLIFNFVVTKE